MKVCIHCFNDLELKRFIASYSDEQGLCDYCRDGSETELLDIEELLDFFAEFFEIFKEDIHGTTLLELIQNDWNLFSDKPESNDVLSDLISILGTSIMNSRTKVGYIDEIKECASYWETLKDNIKWKRRFLINTDLLEELGWDRLFKLNNQIVTLSKSEPLYRARLHFEGDQEIFERKEMGCPPQNKAAAGRANPQGIPYLYLSKSIATTLYEIRASFLDEVSVGIFKIKDDDNINLVDFIESASAFRNIEEIKEYTKIMLLKKFISADISKPIRRYDSKLEYIPTQFICEYIRYITNVDGIQFSSSLHTGGVNIVLFDQEKIECIDVGLHRITKVDIESQNILHG